MSAQENKDLVDHMYAAMNQNVTGVMKEFWTEDMVWRGPGGIGTMHGVEEFEDQVRRPFIHAFPDKVGNDEIRIAEGEFVAAHGYQDTTHAGDWLGIPATGKRVRVHYMDFWRVEDGRLAENWVSIDILDFLEQIGYDVKKILAFVGSKGPEFFDELELG